MKLTHLLAGVAAAAMLGGAASAQYRHTTEFGVASTNNANAAATRYYLNSERALSTLDSATVQVVIDGATTDAGATRTQWDNAGAATFTINLQNAVFSSAVNSTALTGRAAPQAAAAPLEAAPAATAGCLAGDITVSAGGTVGSSSVSFSVANIAACGRQLRFVSANGVQITATNANINTTLIRQLGNTDINGGSSTTNSATAGAFIQSLPALNFRALSPLPRTVIELANYTTLDNVGSNFVLNVRNGRNLITGGGEVVVNNALTAAGGGVTASTATASLGLENAAGFSIAASTLAAQAFGATNSANILAAVNAATGAGGTDMALVLNNAASGSLVKFTQNVTITPAVTYAAATNITAPTYAPITVGRLTRQGQQTQPFTWVGDGTTTSAISVFRHTGFPATPVNVRFILSNASGGAAFNREYVLGSVTATNGEVVTTSLTLSQIAGNFGRADVTWVFDRDNANPINTQRFVQSPTGALAPAPEENANRVNNTAVFN